MFPYLDSVARRYPPVIVWAVIGMSVLAFLGSVAKNPVMGERALVIFGEISDERFQVAPLSG